MLTAFIMAGGSGERFWPLSTKEKPKQLLKLVSDKSMIRETVDRILPLIPSEQIFIGTNSIQAEAIKSELPDIPTENIIIEPSFRDTAAAIGFGSLVINRKYPDATIVVLASDHLIKNEENFRRRLLTAVDISQKGYIVTLGIKPTKPESGYGYIEVEESYVGEPTDVFRFWEKPSFDRAVEYVESGNFLWNSGMFIFTTNTIFKALEEHTINHYKTLQSIKDKIGDLTGVELSEQIKDDFKKFEKISIDFAVMEKAKNIKVIPVDFGWNDVGSFSSLDEIFIPDEDGFVTKDTEVIKINSKDNIIIGTERKKIIATVGVSNLVIVDSEDALLICDKKETQNIKKIVNKLSSK